VIKINSKSNWNDEMLRMMTITYTNV